MIRSAASLRRVPVGRVPRLHQYYQRTPTSRRPSRRTSFPSLGGTTRLPCSLPRQWAAPRAGTAVYRGRPCRISGGDVETSQVPARPVPACPALGPRRNRQHQTISAPRWCLPLLSQRRLPRCLRISWLNHAACKASCVRFADSVTTGHATLGSGWLVNLGRSGLAPAGSQRRFPSCHSMSSPFTKLRLAQDKRRPFYGRRAKGTK